MAKTINDVEQLMIAKGYKLSNQLTSNYGARGTEHIRWSVTRADKQPISYYDEWASIVSIVKGSDYYVFPIKRENNRVKGIRLVKIDHIEKLKKAVRALNSNMMENYWVMQEEEKATELYNNQGKAIAQLRIIIIHVEDSMDGHTYKTIPNALTLYQTYFKAIDKVTDNLLESIDSGIFTKKELQPGNYLL